MVESNMLFKIHTHHSDNFFLKMSPCLFSIIINEDSSAFYGVKLTHPVSWSQPSPLLG